MAKIKVKDTSISIIKYDDTDFISLTDIARFKSEEPNVVIASWLRNRNTIEYLGIWESLYNPDFKPHEFEGFRKEAGLQSNLVGVLSENLQKSIITFIRML